jgi:small subunit ribosomal protein S23
MWLMENVGLTKAEAYDKARREFYRIRHLDAVRRRIAKEEALFTGAYFGKGPLEISMELENDAYEHWRAWAAKEIEAEQASRAQMMSGPATTDAETEVVAEEDADAEPVA